MDSTKKCFACDKTITAGVIDVETLSIKPQGIMVDTRDDQLVEIGPECYRRVRAAKDEGYQPPKGGPRLYLIQK
jgi:hypothetical protein